MTIRRWTSRVASLVIGVIIVTNSIASAQSGTSIVRQSWYETSLDSSSISLAWRTTDPSTSEVWIGEDSTDLVQAFHDDGRSTEHQAIIAHLQSSHTYAVRIYSSAKGSSDSVSFYSSTASGSASSGMIDVHFNRSIDSLEFPTVASGTGNADLLSILHADIEAARSSIDLALYSFSGFTGSSVASWLKQAAKRGVAVRVILDSTASSSSTAYKALRNAQIPVILNSFGLNYDGRTNIHHNKFILFDARGNDEAHALTMTGSWNLTDQQTTTDFQNVLRIQDLSLARAYEREFDEEWGSTTDTPDPVRSKFSTHKTDNTPRTFVVGGYTLHLLFSPNGGISEAISNGLAMAQSSVLLAEYQITQPSLATDLIIAHTRGVQIHGIVGTGGASDETPALQAAGLDVMHFTDYEQFDTLFHHKYCLIDPKQPDATVITGSYNWTAAAETKNNENILIISDPALAISYLAEWTKRYRENGGSQMETVTNISNTAKILRSLRVVQTDGGAEAVWYHSNAGIQNVTILDIMGHVIRTFVSRDPSGQSRLEIGNLPSGAYIVSVQHDGIRESSRCILY